MAKRETLRVAVLFCRLGLQNAAYFTFELNVYTITYTLDDAPVQTEQVNHGDMPTAYQAIEAQGKPATEQYVYTFDHWDPAIVAATQDASYSRVKIGNYPIINVYANLHLKNCRIYAGVNHVNANAGHAFWAPHYAINPLTFRFGLSWNFFN